jgi:hypothetical protein
VSFDANMQRKVHYSRWTEIGRERRAISMRSNIGHAALVMGAGRAITAIVLAKAVVIVFFTCYLWRRESAMDYKFGARKLFSRIEIGFGAVSTVMALLSKRNRASLGPLLRTQLFRSNYNVYSS